MNLKTIAIGALALSAISASIATITVAQTQSNSRLDVVKKRGKLICGVNDKLAGFGFWIPMANTLALMLIFVRAWLLRFWATPAKSIMCR
jgi:ABC-type amino acid transport substrate-binding protein